MNRRFFLATAAAPLAAQQPPRLRIAFLGGAHGHTPAKVAAVKESPDWELVGICEDDPAARRPYEKAGVPFLSRAAVLKDESIRVVAVGSSVKDHARDAHQALAAGKHLHLEKPPSATLPEFRSLLELARGKRLLLQVGYMWRYNPGFRAAIDAARNGWLGTVHTVRGTIDNTGAPAQRPEWAAFKGGQMFELGCHLLDAAVRLLGRPVNIAPFLRRHGGFDDTLADNTAVVLEYPRALAMITSSTLRPNAFRHRFFEIMGSKGTATIAPLEPPALELDLAEAAGPYPAGRSTPKFPPYRRYVDDIAELAQSVRTGRPLTITPEQELLVHETLLRACNM
jgi:predicted dehydrogenase